MARGNIYSRLERLEAGRVSRTEEGRELQALSEAFRRRRAELRGEGS